MKKSYALVTGASSGIGKELCFLLAKDGYNLVLVARSQDALKQVKKEIHVNYAVDTRIYPQDLSNVNAAKEIYEYIKKEKITLEILINNAGFGEKALFSDMDIESVEQMMQTNMYSLTMLTKFCLPDMCKRKKGYILHIASVAGMLPGPYMAVYYATKAYVISFSEALSHELRGSGVSSTVLCPGPTRTNFAKRAHVENSKLFALSAMSAESVAKIGYRAMMQHKRKVVAGFINQLQGFLIPFTPHFLSLPIVAAMQQKRKTKNK